jgi:hypothetical protein
MWRGRTAAAPGRTGLAVPVLRGFGVRPDAGKSHVEGDLYGIDVPSRPGRQVPALQCGHEACGRRFDVRFRPQHAGVLHAGEPVLEQTLPHTEVPADRLARSWSWSAGSLARDPGGQP